MVYVDGYIIPVPKKNLQTYRHMAQQGCKMWKKHGVIAYYECVGDDLNPKMTGIKFPKTVKAKPSEKVVFSFIIFKSKTHRDRVNAKVMKEFMNDPKFKGMSMPFDMKRMVYGGFKVMVSG
ncbi:MAG: DUF1428 domain-containing protein [Nitrosopumilaceae archaeon]